MDWYLKKMGTKWVVGLMSQPIFDVTQKVSRKHGEPLSYFASYEEAAAFVASHKRKTPPSRRQYSKKVWLKNRRVR